MTHFAEDAMTQQRHATVDISPELLSDFATAICEEGIEPRGTTAQSPLCATAPAAAAIADLMRAVPAPEFAARGLLSEIDVTMHRQLTPGMRLVTKAAVFGLRARRRGTQLSVIARSTSEETLVSSQLITLYFPGAESEDLGKEPPSLRDTSDHSPNRIVRTRLRPSQPEEYARATGDWAPVHFDEALARSLGLRGVIMHGTCTLAAVVDTLARATARDARRVAARFRAPVYPTDIVTTRLAKLSADEVGFTSITETGVVLSHGLVEWERA